MKKIHKKLIELQKEIKVPKTHWNDFGKFWSRNNEDILKALKPMLGEYVILQSDEIIEVGGRVYVEATSTLTDGEEVVSAKAQAREENARPKMSEPQLTGTASSYARKYSLGGLLGLDDGVDSDTLPIQSEKPETTTTKKKLTDKEFDNVLMQSKEYILKHKDKMLLTTDQQKSLDERLNQDF